MIIDLPPQLQSISTGPTYAVIEAYQLIQLPESKPKQTPQNSDHFGGYVTFSGTTASGVSGSIVQGYIPEFTPWDSPIPSVIIQLNFEARLLELAAELRTK